MAKNKGGVYVYQQMMKTLAEWLAEIKPIPARVLCWESDTGIIRMGDGVSMYKDLPPRLSSGLSPRINDDTKNWEIFNISTKEWDDTGIKPVLAPNIDGGSPSSVYTAPQIFDFGKINY